MIGPKENQSLNLLYERDDSSVIWSNFNILRLKVILGILELIHIDS